MTTDARGRRLIKLYGGAPTRATRPIWLLNELGLDCEIVALNPLDPEDRKQIEVLNPSAKVPVLVDGDMTLTESVAIMHYLAERYGSGRFIPTDVVARAGMHRWNYFLVAEIEQPLWREALHTAIYPEEERSDTEIGQAKRDCRKELAQVEAHLDGRDLFGGAEPSVADFNAAYVLDWADEVGLLDASPNCRRFVTRMYERSAAPVRIVEGFEHLNGGRTPPRYRRDIARESVA